MLALVGRAGSGYLVPARDAAAIATRLLDLKHQRQAAAALGENGRHFVERHHARRELATQFARVVLESSAIPAGVKRVDVRAGFGKPRTEVGGIRQSPPR